MPQIQQLPPSVVNKIAAGEVIERPASVVKELVENSLDAGARRIEVTIEQGGSELVRISDDGCGIAPDQLLLAVASHATSKIRSADDLFSVATLGFRGEALASIAEVSRMLIRSRTDQSQAGAELEVFGGQARDIAPCGCPVGTTIEIRNLFYNTPVRRKFLRTPQTEMGHITEAFTRLALAYQEVHFTLRHGTRVIYDLPPTAAWQERIERFFGAELAEGLLQVQSEPDDIRLSGYVANPSHSRGHNRMQYLFLNGRHIRDRSLQHAMGEAYRGLLLTGRHPICFLRLEMPADLVDVNVHPTKLEVRFQEAGRVYSQLLGTLRTKFLTTDLTARLQPVADSEAVAVSASLAPDDTGEGAQKRRELVDWAKGELAKRTAAPNQPPRESVQFEFPVEQLSDSPASAQTFPPLGDLASFSENSPPFGEETEPAQSRDFDSRPERETQVYLDPAHRVPSRISALQVHNRYLVAESDQGMLIIDQHALHERILYEQIREKVLRGALETQRLLVPEPIDLSSQECAAVVEAKELLAQLGFQVEPFGGDTVLVSSYPAMLANNSPREMLREVVDRLLNGGTKTPDRRDLLDSLMHMLSCKAAIKAGDRLSPEEVEALVQLRELAQDAHHCPHGRPTMLEFTKDELDRQFKRT